MRIFCPLLWDQKYLGGQKPRRLGGKCFGIWKIRISFSKYRHFQNAFKDYTYMSTLPLSFSALNLWPSSQKPLVWFPKGLLLMNAVWVLPSSWLLELFFFSPQEKVCPQWYMLTLAQPHNLFSRWQVYFWPQEAG